MLVPDLISELKILYVQLYGHAAPLAVVKYWDVQSVDFLSDEVNMFKIALEELGPFSRDLPEAS